MLTRKLFRLLVLIGLAFSLAGFVVQAAAQDASAGTCSNATLNGNYGYVEEGTGFMPLPFAGAPTPPYAYAGAGSIAFDGNGNSAGRAWASLGGFTAGGAAEQFTGSYSVSTDCIVSGQFLGSAGIPLFFTGAITGGGMQQEIHYTYVNDPSNPTSPAPLVAVGTMKKTPQGGCSVATLSGTYGLSGKGLLTAVPHWLIALLPPGAPVPPPPLFGAHAGRVVADGTGNMSGSDVENLEGMIMPTTFDITYTVDSDCAILPTITATTPLGGSNTIHEAGVITGEGNSQEVHTIVTDADWVFIDAMRRSGGTGGAANRFSRRNPHMSRMRQEIRLATPSPAGTRLVLPRTVRNVSQRGNR